MSQLYDQARSLFPFATAQGHDHKAWAKRIAWRVERGDKDVTTLQMQFAQIALGTVKQAVK